MTSKKIRLSILLIGISFLSACSTPAHTVRKPETEHKQITKVYTRKMAKEKTPAPEPVIQLRDSPRVHRALSYFNGSGKTFIDDGLERKTIYADMIKEELEAQGLPEELSNVALLESRFIKDARSPCGAVGIWQFMSGTARSLGLEVGIFTDERKDPRKSTKAAATYLRKLHEELDDWFLAIAAYNAGSGSIKKAIERCGTRDFFKFEPCSGLSNETLDFVSRFVAATAITRRLKYYED